VISPRAFGMSQNGGGLSTRARLALENLVSAFVRPNGAPVTSPGRLFRSSN